MEPEVASTPPDRTPAAFAYDIYIYIYIERER